MAHVTIASRIAYDCANHHREISSFLVQCMTRKLLSVLVRSQGASVKPNAADLPLPKPRPPHNWTILEWSPTRLKYVRRGQQRESPKPSKRNPRVDDLFRQRQKIDAFANVFVNTVRTDPVEAEALLHDIAIDYTPNALEEYAMVLAMHTKKVPALPPTIQNRYKRIEQALHLPSPQKAQPASPLEILSRPMPGFNGDLSEAYDQMTPDQQHQFEIDYLRFNWQRQTELDAPENLPPLFAELRTKWKTGARYRPLEEYSVLHSIKTKVPDIVASEMAHVALHIAATKFPLPVTNLCKRIGGALENALLKNQAEQLNLPYFRKSSSLLWGMLGAAAWTSKDKLVVGSVYVEEALKKFKFLQPHPATGELVERPAFWRTFHIQGTLRRGIVALNPALLNNKSTNPGADQMPMVVAPQKWTSISDGGFYSGSRSRKLTLLAPGMRSNEQVETVASAIQSGNMNRALDGLDKLSKCAWKINRAVLSVIKTLTARNIVVSDMPEECDSQYDQALEIAEALAQHGHRFYAPAYLDFRGRCYTSTGSKLSHMSGDSFRALHEFWYGRPLGPDGLHALELHLANVYGSAKGRSIQERIEWAHANRTNIIEAASDPLTNKWWTKAEKPFQALAAACEIERALSSSDPRNFISHLPVAIDGSCNGLQHLTALVREETIAPHVNLTKSTASDKPGDIYSHVATSIEGASRDMVKTPVMTAFYGASKMGMVKSLLDKHDFKKSSKLVEELTTKLASQLDRQFSVQRWLTENTKRICNSTTYLGDEGCGIAWTQPILGLPVVQPYSTAKLMAVRTPLQAFFVDSPFHPTIPDVYKQQASVAANYVHTLDAAHMLLTATSFKGTFAAVHDSYWTHAGDITRLARTLREQFVILHEKPLLDQLQAEWTERYGSRFQLCTIYSGSKAYEQLKWLRSGKRVTDELLQQELHNPNEAWTVVKEYVHEIEYVNGLPRLGKGSRSTKAWIPLRISDPPKLGSWNPQEVLDSTYFFN